jgi:hypothetical protein
MGEHSNVHNLASDCEIHVGAKLPNNSVIAAPRGIVVEPPNVCRQRVPLIRQTGSISAAWTNYFTANVTNQTCDVVGFPRLFSEHSAGGGAGGSNPDHVVEIHPAIQMICGTDSLDFLSLLRVHEGMRAITPTSTAACVSQRRLYVRQRGSGSAVRYEFLEEGAKSTSGRCGNFVVVDAHINKEYLRSLSNGADHASLARVWIGENGPHPLKIYTYAGTPEDARIAALAADPDEYAEIQLTVHGLLTYDYLTIAQALQDDNFSWLPANELRDFKEVRGPLALIVFGRARE